MHAIVTSVKRLLGPIDVERVVVLFHWLATALLAAVAPVLGELEHALTAFPLSHILLRLLLMRRRRLARQRVFVASGAL